MSVIKSLIAGKTPPITLLNTYEGDYPGSPKMFWTYVDVRDVAE
jgi:hypothetical protein